MPWLAALEELLVERVDLPLGGLSTSPDCAATDFWSGSITPVLDVAEQPDIVPVLDHEDRARLALASLRLTLVGFETGDVSPRHQRLAQAVQHGAGVPALRRAPTSRYHLDLLARDAETPLPVGIDALMRALTGTLRGRTFVGRSPSRRVEGCGRTCGLLL